MECNFFVGQKVVCVNAMDIRSPAAPRLLVEGEVYVIRGVLPELFGKWMNVLIEGHPAPVPFYAIADGGWRADRFRPATDITQFRELVAAILTGKVTELPADAPV